MTTFHHQGQQVDSPFDPTDLNNAMEGLDHLSRLPLGENKDEEDSDIEERKGKQNERDPANFKVWVDQR